MIVSEGGAYRDTTRCPKCGRALRREDASFDERGEVVCRSCANSESVVSMRGDRMSPLMLGIISLFCNPLLIVSILAIVRGIDELRIVRSLSRQGITPVDATKVQTEAIIGILLGSAPALLVVLVLGCVLSSVLGAAGTLGRGEQWDPYPPPPPRDELGEIIDSLRASPHDRPRAARRLQQLAMRFDAADRERAIRAAGGYFELNEGELAPSVLLVRAGCQHLTDAELPLLEEVWTLLPPDAQAEVLLWLEAMNSPPSRALREQLSPRNPIVAYLRGAELQAEDDAQRTNVCRALGDLASLPVERLRRQRYRDYRGRPRRWDLPEVLRHHFVPAEPIALPEDDFWEHADDPTLRAFANDYTFSACP